MTPAILWFEQIGPEDAQLVGGKGLNLGLMTAAGLPVPPGFVITQAAYSAPASRAGHELPPSLAAEILAAYAQLQRGLVAVRSSATGEDGAEFSFAGQQETILGVEGDDALLASVLRCWQSLHTERAIAYRQAQRIDDASVAMAVVVQRLILAEVSGVLFTRDPLDATGQQLLVEAAPGLGEAVVSGRVMPDRFHLDRATGDIVEQHLSAKREWLSHSGWLPVPAEQQSQPCLTAHQLAQLAELSRRIETYYGAPRDVEWAFADGRLHVLQARPITAIDAFELAEVRRSEMERVGQIAEFGQHGHRSALTVAPKPVAPQRVIWGRYNLAEVLPTPTPLTWSIVQRFMSGRGGFGQMFRDLGYDPDPVLEDAGFLDLICGRPYVNLDREPKLFFRDFPYGYDFDAIRARPELGMYPQLVTVPARKTSRFWWRLPAIAWRMFQLSGRIKRLMATESQRLPREVFPQFAARVAKSRLRSLTALSSDEILVELEQEIQATLFDFARESLRPSVLAATALAELEQLLSSAGIADPAAAARQLVMGVSPPPECDLAGGLRSLVTSELSRADFLARFGHRGSQEMELSQPRWSERPETLPQPSGDASKPSSESLVALESIVDLGKHPQLRRPLLAAIDRARVYLALRESSKHYLMLGYARIREILLEVGRRTSLGEGIFFLELAELPRALAGEPLNDLIAQRKRRRKALLALAAPPVLFSDDLEAIGRAVAISGAAVWTATPLSFGEFTGPALVLDEPIPAEGIAAGFVLVCPSTDPAWVPLFLKAGALVMESGGVLSHGAIVAREFGIPAVAGIADVQRRVKTGQRLRVDGTTGEVQVLED